MKIITKINSDQDVKKLSELEQVQLAQEVRELIIATAKKTPLHLSSNLGIAETTIALMQHFDLNKDKVLYDTGHQTYVHKILTGRRDAFHTIRQEGGITGFLNMEESKYDHYSPGHSGNILSVASGMYQSLKNVKSNPPYIVAVIGDAALANGLAFEALNDIVYHKEKIIIILNDNEMSISKAVGGLSNYLSSFSLHYPTKNHLLMKNIFLNLGFLYLGPTDGNNLSETLKVVKEAKELVKQGPVIVHLKTKKGYGQKEAEQDICGNFHSYHQAQEHDMSFGIEATNKVYELMKKDKSIFVINPAMTRSSNCEKIANEFCDRYFDVGIAEEHAIAKAGGMALVELKPIVYIYSSFLQRAYDQLLHDCARLKLNVTLLIDRADTSGGDGPTHHGVYDVAFLKTIEHTCITSPRNVNQLFQLIDLSQVSKNKIFAIRYPKWYFSNAHDFNSNYQIEPGRWEWFDKYQSKTLIISYGPYVNKILAEIANEHHIDVVNAIYINEYDEQELKKVFLNYNKIIVYERIKSNYGIVDDLYKYAYQNNYQAKIIAMNYATKPLGHGSSESLDQKADMDIAAIKKYL